MKICGIVCEYNPMHSGHLYQLSKAKEISDAVVCCMSGNFVQRGEPAYLNKWSRAEIAIQNGADLVVLLPCIWSLSSAKDFAYAAISLLKNAGVNELVCGVEDDDVSIMKKILEVETSPEFSKIINQYSTSGLNYPSSFSKACFDIIGEETQRFLLGANNTLALEYFRAINKLSSNMSFLPFKRVGQWHNSVDLSEDHISSSAIRAQEDISTVEKFLAPGSMKFINEAKQICHFPSSLNFADKPLLYSLQTLNKSALLSYVGNISLANRIERECKNTTSIGELVKNVKSKTFTQANIKRSILRAFLAIPFSLCQSPPPYFHALAASKRGLDILKMMKAQSSVPVITRFSDTKNLSDKERSIYFIESKASDFYGYFLPEMWQSGQEQTHSIIIKE